MVKIEFRNHVFVDMGEIETISGDSLKKYPADIAWSVSPARYGAGEVIPISWIANNEIKTGCIAL